MVCGIVGFFTFFFGLGFLLGLAAVILGIVAFSSKKPSKGKGMAIAGLVLGGLEVAGGLMALVFLSRFFL